MTGLAFAAALVLVAAFALIGWLQWLRARKEAILSISQQLEDHRREIAQRLDDMDHEIAKASAPRR